MTDFDSKKERPEGLRAFIRDKRVRRTSAEKVERTPGGDRSAFGSRTPREKHDGEAPRRRSFNPNFTPDNKLVNGSMRSGHRTDRPSGEFHRRGYGYRSPEISGSDEQPDYNRSDSFAERSSGFHAGGNRRQHPASRMKKGDDFPSKRSGAARYGKAVGAGAAPKKKKSKFPDYRDGNYPKYPAPEPDGAIRLNRYLAMSGLCSRREADEYIEAGVVTVNGKVVSELGSKVMPGDEVRFNDEPLSSEKKVYILMNKPKGFVTTIEDPHADRTVMDLVKNICKERVYPVGRLDKNSLGVLLITNDGDLTKQLTHPAYNKRKVYQVTLNKPMTHADMQRILEGIELEDGPIRADDIDFAGKSPREVGIEIHSGKNRIVRRIFEHLGYSVLRLDRVYFAGLTKKKLKRGQWRFLSDQEVAMLKSGKYE